MPKRRLAVALSALVVLAAPAGAAARSTGTLPQRLARALSVPHVSRAATGAVALDLSTGDLLFAQNQRRPLVPASNEKLLVTYTALETLGPGYTIETDVLGAGRLVGSTWRGYLVLQGHGDPSLSTNKLDGLARQVRARGIRRVAGGVVGDESFFDGRRTAPGWSPSFYINESPPLSALTVDRAWFHGHTSGAPALAAAYGLVAALRRAGVAVTGGAAVGTAPADALRLASVQSPPLAALLRYMDRESDNFTAELLLKQLAAVDDGLGTTAGGAAIVYDTLATDGIPVAGVHVVDGSGLSQLDRVTARTLGSLLQAAWSDALLRPWFVSALAVAGRSGTLEHRLRAWPARGSVVAKTGTTRIASALSGYVRGRYVFSVLQNGYPIATAWARRAQDRFATVLAAQ